jgi:PAS domain S-box-containing protein
MRSAKFILRYAHCLFLLIGVFPFIRIFPVQASSSIDFTTQEKKWLAAHPVIRVAPDPDFPPIERFDENGQFVGIAADYVKMIEKKLDLKFTIVQCASWEEILKKAKNREIDVLSAAAQTPNRGEYLLFTEPHIVFPGVIITRTDVREKLSLHDLSNMKVGIVSGYVWQEFIARDFPKVVIDPVADVQTGLKKVSFGMNDAMVENLATATHCIGKEGITNLRVAGETGYFTRLSFASRKDWPELNGILNKALISLPQEERKAVYDKWIRLDGGRQVFNRTFWVVLILVLTGAFMIIFFILLWSRSLQRQVQYRTSELQSELAERKRVECALRESENRFLEMVEHANSIILRMDCKGDIQFFNAFACNFFGYAKEDILGRNMVGTIVPPVDSSGQDLAAKMDHLKIHPEQYEKNENENMRKDGSRVWVSWSNKQILDKNGQTIGLLCVGNDITEIKLVQEELRNERDFSNAVFDTAGALVAVFDREGRIIRFNHTCERITGFSHEQVIGKEFWGLFLLQGEVEKVKTVFANLIAGDFPNKNENYWRTRENGNRLIEWYNTCICDNKGNVEYIISTGIDITDHRKAEMELERYRTHLEELVDTRTTELSKTVEQLQGEILERNRVEDALRESERRYRFLFEESPSGCLILDTNSIILDVGNHFLKHLGYARQELIGKPAYDFMPPEEYERVRMVLNRRMRGEQIEEGDNKVIAKDGSTHFVVFSGSQTLLHENEKLAGILITGEDVTLRRKAEALARQQQQSLIQADKMASLGILVSGVAHEINNPNNFIILNADNLRDIWRDTQRVLDEFQKEHGDIFLAGLPYTEVRTETEQLIGGISEGAKRIKNIVQNLKDFARHETDDLNESVDVNAVIGAATVILGNLIRKSTDRFVFKPQANTPRVRGNFQKIEQVVINLITNACQALTNRNQAVYVSTVRAADSQRLALTISDEGMGISPENLKHIMDPFFTTKRDGGGTGLGLSISYSIIKEHGGDLIIDSKPGTGTTATVLLPILQENNHEQKPLS